MGLWFMLLRVESGLANLVVTTESEPTHERGQG